MTGHLSCFFSLNSTVHLLIMLVGLFVFVVTFFLFYVCVYVCFGHPAMSKDVLVDLCGVLNTDAHILATGHTGIHTQNIHCIY